MWFCFLQACERFVWCLMFPGRQTQDLWLCSSGDLLPLSLWRSPQGSVNLARSRQLISPGPALPKRRILFGSQFPVPRRFRVDPSRVEAWRDIYPSIPPPWMLKSKHSTRFLPPPPSSRPSHLTSSPGTDSLHHISSSPLHKQIHPIAYADYIPIIY